jgi:hypothetical protein
MRIVPLSKIFMKHRHRVLLRLQDISSSNKCTINERDKHVASSDKLWTLLGCNNLAHYVDRVIWASCFTTGMATVFLDWRSRLNV